MPIGTWDTRSGVRERLYLLATVKDLDPSRWRYDPIGNRWVNLHDKQVSRSAPWTTEESLKELSHRGISKDDAFDLIWNEGEERIGTTGRLMLHDQRCWCGDCARRRAVDALAEIRRVFIEREEWKELNSCADAVQDVSHILTVYGFGPGAKGGIK